MIQNLRHGETKSETRKRDFFFSQVVYAPKICLWTGGASKLLTTSNQGFSTIKKEFFEIWAKNKTGFSKSKTSKFFLNLVLLRFNKFCEFLPIDSGECITSLSSCSTGNAKSIQHIALKIK